MAIKTVPSSWPNAVRADKKSKKRGGRGASVAAANKRIEFNRRLKLKLKSNGWFRPGDAKPGLLVVGRTARDAPSLRQPHCYPNHIKMIGDHWAGSSICVPDSSRRWGGAAAGSGYDCVCRNSYKQSPPTICPWERRNRGLLSSFFGMQIGSSAESHRAAFACGIRKQESPRARGSISTRFRFGLKAQTQRRRWKTPAKSSTTLGKIGRPLRKVASNITN